MKVSSKKLMGAYDRLSNALAAIEGLRIARAGDSGRIVDLERRVRAEMYRALGERREELAALLTEPMRATVRPEDVLLCRALAEWAKEQLRTYQTEEAS